MIGILVQLALTWLIAWLFDKKDLSVLGLRPTKQRVAYFILLFLLTAFLCASGFLLKMYVGNQNWKLNPNLSTSLVLDGTWWNIKSVLFEELIFRGVLLYMLIRKWGANKAIILSAIAFGIYHWFSFGVIGNPVQMIFVFILTGSMGLLLAYCYAKTYSLFYPIAIHFGWNLTQGFVFSDGPIGNGILVPAEAYQFRTNSYLVFFLVTFGPVLLALVLNYILVRRSGIAEVPST